jgi:hypothetical protein
MDATKTCQRVVGALTEFSRMTHDVVVAADTGERSERLNLYLPKGLLAALDEWRRHEKDIPTRSEAARRLIAQALKASGRFGGSGDSPSKPRPS